jgi:predicted transcriptional regulator
LSTTEKDESNILRGTTLRVYNFMFKMGKPIGIHELQRGLGLSSPSLALYHINKLVQAGLIREQNKGYVVDKIVFANMIRIKRALIPFQTTYTVFFTVTLMILLTYLRPLEVTSTYVFALVVNSVAILTSLYEVIRALRKI